MFIRSFTVNNVGIENGTKTYILSVRPMGPHVCVPGGGTRVCAKGGGGGVLGISSDFKTQKNP